MCPTSDPFFFETFLSFVEKKKGFVAKIRNLLGFVLNLQVPHWVLYKTIIFIAKPKRFRIFATKPFFFSTKLKKVSKKKGSEVGHTVRSFKGSVDFFIPFLKL